MYCPKCLVSFNYDPDEELSCCAICGGEFKYTAEDVLGGGKYGIAREKRPAQIELATCIEEAIEFITAPNPSSTVPKTLLLEGGTGIGKSFAYLVPVLLNSAILHHRIAISTAKKALQDQLVNKDLPLLRDKMAERFAPHELQKLFTVYKGNSNYACWMAEKIVPKDGREQYSELIAQARQAGTPADYALLPGKRPYWADKASIEHCSRGTRCKLYNVCRPKPSDYAIVVTNHHILAIDSMLGGNAILGKFATLIIDEAHQLPDTLRSACSKEVSLKGVKRLSEQYKQNDLIHAALRQTSVGPKELGRQLKAMSGLCKAALKELKAYTAFDTKIISIPADPDKLVKLHDWTLHMQEVGAVLKHAESQVSQLVWKSGQGTGYDVDADELAAAGNQLTRLSRKVSAIEELLVNLCSDPEDADTNNCVTATEDGIKIQPIDIKDIYAPNLKKRALSVHLSATLAMGADFKYYSNQLGIDLDTAQTKVLNSPFDYSTRNTFLYAPWDLPKPAHDGQGAQRDKWIAAIVSEICRIVRCTRGNAFILFGARTDMMAIWEAMPARFWPENNLFGIVQEGEASATLRSYLSRPGGVLFGLKSFWEGVDVPGDQLRAVIIPKLPFPFFKDPLILRRSAVVKANGGNPFHEIQIPLMVFDVKQGLGRLIRTQSDRGIAAVLDPRIWTGQSKDSVHNAVLRRIRHPKLKTYRKPEGYGEILQKSLPFECVSPEFEHVKEAAKAFFPA